MNHKKTALLILLSLITVSGSSQIWDYPPAPTKYHDPNSTIKRDNVKTLKIYTYDLEHGLRTGKKILIIEQHFDSLGNTTTLIENSTDTTRSSKSTIQKFESSIEYDALNRPIKQTIGDESKFWIYQDNQLKEYYVTKFSKMIEKRQYRYDGHNLYYTLCLFDETTSTICDTVMATMSEQKNPIKIVSISHYGQLKKSTEMTIDYDSAGNNLGGKVDCSRIQFQYSKDGYRTRFLRFDCNDKLVEDQEYQYIYYE